MFEKLEVGSQVIYTDKHFVDRVALVTAIWGSPDWRDHCPDAMGQMHVPCINLVYVSGDSAKDDPYGRQLERDTSVVHASSQPAGGSCWRMADEPRPPMGVVEK
ncbi:MAG: hypothetical protein GTN69_02480 [Armatimonadetes bacterium]|nr:hypothetical protein [Armatimonadota bacterium]